MSTSKDRHPDPAAATQALEWFIDLQANVTAQQQEAFADWLRRSPVHVEEFLHLTALRGDLAQLPDLKNMDVAAVLAEARIGSVATENIIPLDRLQDRAFQDQKKAARADLPFTRLRRMSVFGAAAALVLGVVALGVYAPIRDRLATHRYTTAIGEQRFLTLNDGSNIQLNVRSSLTAIVNNTVRDVHLQDGEALFQVAKDPARPFRVHTPQATIEAKGTQFNVDVKRGATTVTLLEGHVEVQRSGAKDPILLSPGQQVVVSGRTAESPKPHSADLKVATAWTEHRLIFEDAPLSEVIDEFNRYSPQPLTIEDPTLRNARVTASFESSNAQTFVDSLAAAGGLRVIRQADGSWLLERQ